jgi:hypothetical protein
MGPEGSLSCSQQPAPWSLTWATYIQSKALRNISLHASFIVRDC